jgi:UTRA domain
VLLHAREASLLDQPRRSPALLVEGLAFTADGRPVELARTFVRGDRTRYYLERTVAVAPLPRAERRTEETRTGQPV